MATPSILNFEQLLEPIAGGKVNGPDLRLDYTPGAIYQEIRDAREQSRSVERQMLEGNPDYSSDQLEWEKVVQLSIKAIAEKSKDFQIAAWLCEALLRRRGFAGLRDGFLVSRKLAEEYWSGLYPMPEDEEEEGVEPTTEEEIVTTRVKPFEGLFTGALAQAIQDVKVTEHDHYTLADQRQSQDLDKESDPEARKAKIDAGVPTYGEFNSAVDSSSPEFYQTLHDDLTECIGEFERFSASLEEKCGKDAKGFSLSPPTTDLTKFFDATLKTIVELGKSKGLFADEVEMVEGEGGEAGQLVASASQNGGRQGFSREDAFKQLTILAEFFRRSEPHSPVSHHIDEAVRWGRMALPELLMELIPDDRTRQEVLTRVGILEKENN
jgi:type VI secretion system protein ImpA